MESLWCCSERRHGCMENELIGKEHIRLKYLDGNRYITPQPFEDHAERTTAQLLPHQYFIICDIPNTSEAYIFGWRK